MLEELSKRKESLFIQLENAQNRIDQGIADLNAINGAIQEVEHWINFLENTEE